MVMINRDMFLTTQALAEEKCFRESIQLSERQEEQAYSQELVLRFFAQRDFEGPNKELSQDFGEYLTNWMRAIATGPGISEGDADLFRRTFELLAAAAGDDVFKKWDGGRHKGPFSISCFEFITSGVSHNLEKWSEASPEELADRIRKVWDDEVFQSWSGSGMSTRRRVPRLVNRSRAYFA